MKLPNVSNVLKLEGLDSIFELVAYRETTEKELLQAYAYFRSTKQGKKLKRNTRYTVISTIGGREPRRDIEPKSFSRLPRRE